MNQNKQDLTTGPLVRHMLKMSVPMSIGLFAAIAFNITDTFFVAQLGTSALTAISFTFPVVFTVVSLIVGMGVGVSSVVSRAAGDGDHEKVQKYATYSLILVLIMATCCLTAGILTIEPLFTAMGADEKTLPLIKAYMEIWYLGMFFQVIPMIANSAIRAVGQAKFPALLMMMGGFLNVLFDPILIFGYFGCPALGIRGAAIATVIARFTTCLLALWYLHNKVQLLHWKVPRIKELFTFWKPVLYVGLPSAMNQVMGPISVGFVTALLAGYSSKTVAGYGAATRIELFFMIGVYAVASGCAPIFGQNWGKGLYQRVDSTLKKTYLYSLVYGPLIAGLLFVAGGFFVAIFDSDIKVIQEGTRYLQIVPISLVGVGIFSSTNACFNAIGKPIFAWVLTLFLVLVLFIPFAYLGNRYGGPTGIFWGCCLANILGGLCAFLWGRWFFRNILPSTEND